MTVPGFVRVLSGCLSEDDLRAPPVLGLCVVALATLVLALPGRLHTFLSNVGVALLLGTKAVLP